MTSNAAEQTTNATHTSPTPAQEQDIVEGIAHAAPFILPLAGGVLMFLLAFIAVYMA
ncbi:MAG: hypothetical protein HYX42_16095 [Polaromonas sp.]|uniref:hypothetical protein n=1 Tax=Polaromonas sp. TaxID=1869339 RepID=UPI0025F09A6B|nr:hypothetical protein [Polaromonas sp.]MBI2727763.1 hypothetical protein [Polaromonas sp.]